VADRPTPGNSTDSTPALLSLSGRSASAAVNQHKERGNSDGKSHRILDHRRDRRGHTRQDGRAGRRPGGIIGDLIVGIIGAFVGGWLFMTFLGHTYSGWMGSTFVAFVGAMVLLFVIRAVTGRRTGAGY
jgi:uncharacterized membrane protein YeaQ/YmgE (transglycosylase-associated protein family)